MSLINLTTCPNCRGAHYAHDGHVCPETIVPVQEEVLTGTLQDLPPIPKKIETQVSGVTKRVRRKKTHWDNATPRQQIFVNELLNGSTLKDAGKAIQMKGDDHKVTVKASNMLQQPGVYLVLQERLNLMYPNLSKQVAQKLKYLLDQPIKLKKDDPGISVKEFFELATYLKNIQGWDAPKKTAHLRANTSFKFPTSGGDK